MSPHTMSPRGTLFAAVAVLVLTAVLLVRCDNGTGSTLAPTSTQATVAMQTTTSAPRRAAQIATKGMELYSWQTETGEWRYSILFGTNMTKTMEAIRASPMGLDEAKTAISKLAVGQTLAWVGGPCEDPSTGELVVLPIPPDEVVQELRQYASLRQVNLSDPRH